MSMVPIGPTLAQATASWAPSAELAVDLLTGDFPWITFLMGQPWGLNLLDERVTSMHLVCDSRQQPVIDVFTRGRPEIRRRITFNGRGARLSESA